MKLRPLFSIGSMIFILFLLSACRERAPDIPVPEQVFVAPTAAARATLPVLPAPPTPSPSPAPQVFIPTATPACTDALTFLEDLTIPDGAQVAPKAPLDKRWRVQNSGTCNWDESYSVQLIAGSEIEAPQRLALFPARSNSEAEVRIQFTAPAEPGAYRIAWQAFSPHEQPFGDPFYIEFNVVAQ